MTKIETVETIDRELALLFRKYGNTADRVLQNIHGERYQAWLRHLPESYDCGSCRDYGYVGKVSAQTQHIFVSLLVLIETDEDEGHPIAVNQTLFERLLAFFWQKICKETLLSPRYRLNQVYICRNGEVYVNDEDRPIYRPWPL